MGRLARKRKLKSVDPEAPKSALSSDDLDRDRAVAPGREKIPMSLRRLQASVRMMESRAEGGGAAKRWKTAAQATKGGGGGGDNGGGDNGGGKRKPKEASKGGRSGSASGAGSRLRRRERRKAMRARGEGHGGRPSEGGGGERSARFQEDALYTTTRGAAATDDVVEGGEQPRYDAGGLAATTDEAMSADPPRFGEQAYRPPRLDNFRASFERAKAKRNRGGGAEAAPGDVGLPEDDETAEREARKVQQMQMMRERVRESYAAVRNARYAAAAQRQNK